MNQNLMQIRTAHAFEEAAQHANDEKFLALAQELPMMFQMNGFLATWAFLLAKKKEEHQKTLTALLRHFQEPRLNLPLPHNHNDPHALFLRWIGEREGVEPLSTVELQRLTEEAIEFAGWLKRAAKTYGGGDD